MIGRWALVGILGCVACKGERREPAPMPADRVVSDQVLGSGATAEPVFSNGQQISRDAIPSLPFAIDKVYDKQQPSDAPPYHAAGGSWTFFDAHVAKDPAATFTIGVPPLAGGDEPSFGKMILVPTTAAAGGRVVQAFAKAFDVPVPAPAPGQLSPTRVSIAVLGHGIANEGNGFGGPGTWDATKWFFTVDDDDDIEIFFNFSLAEKRGELSEKDADYDKNVARALAMALRDGKPAPRSPANDPTVAAKPAELVLGVKLPGKSVEVIASTAERAIAVIHYSDRSALVAIDLASGTVQPLYTTPHSLGVGSCDRELRRCVFDEVTPKSPKIRTAEDPSRLLLLEGAKPAPLDVSMGPYDLLWMAPAGDFLVTGGLGAYTAWDLRGRRKVATLADEHAVRDFVAWRGTAMLLAHHAAATETKVDRYELWHVDTGKLETISQPPESLGSVSPDGKLRIDAVGGKVIVTPQPGGASRTLALHPNDYKAVDGSCCEWLDAHHVTIPGRQFAFFDTEAMKVSLVPAAPDDDERTIRVLPGSGHALVTTAGDTYLATVKP